MQSLTNKVKTIRLHDAVAAGTSDVTDCSVVDMQGYSGVRFLVGFGAITSGAVTSIKVQEAAAKTSATALTSGQDIAGSGITVADTDDNTVVISDIIRPQKRYLQPYIDRGTQNAVVDFVLAELYGPMKLPVTQDATVSHSEVAASPAEGTA